MKEKFDAALVEALEAADPLDESSDSSTTSIPANILRGTRRWRVPVSGQQFCAERGGGECCSQQLATSQSRLALTVSADNNACARSAA